MCGVPRLGRQMAFAPVHDVILLPAGGLREAVGGGGARRSA